MELKFVWCSVKLKQSLWWWQTAAAAAVTFAWGAWAQLSSFVTCYCPARRWPLRRASQLLLSSANTTLTLNQFLFHIDCSYILSKTLLNTLLNMGLQCILDRILRSCILYIYLGIVWWLLNKYRSKGQVAWQIPVLCSCMLRPEPVRATVVSQPFNCQPTNNQQLFGALTLHW